VDFNSSTWHGDPTGLSWAIGITVSILLLGGIPLAAAGHLMAALTRRGRTWPAQNHGLVRFVLTIQVASLALTSLYAVVGSFAVILSWTALIVPVLAIAVSLVSLAGARAWAYVLGHVAREELSSIRAQ